MPNFIVSYDLNGRTPTHAQMDQHISKSSRQYARILETVWYVKRDGTSQELFDYVYRILSPNDRLIVIQAGETRWHNLLVNDQSLSAAWNSP